MTLQRLRSALAGPAANLHLCAILTLAAAAALLIAATLLPAKLSFLVVAVPTIAVAMLLLHLAARADVLRFERVLSRTASSVGLTVGPTDGAAPSVLAVLLYCAGVIGAAAGYAWLALTDSGVSRQDVIVQWGLMDKRQLVFLYVVAAAFAVFHHAVARIFLDRSGRAPVDGRRGRVRGWLRRLFGAVAIAVLAYCWIGSAALREVVPGDGPGLAKFYDFHSHVHLAALSQIRLGAVPYLEAQTQYGLGNLLLLHGLTDWLSFSNHGFHAGVILFDVVCIITFFVVLQQVLGLGWAVAGLAGWALWPSPADVLYLPGWAILTRWLAVPILALVLAWLLLGKRSGRRSWIAPVLAGALWGAGGFMSQESLSGGLLVFVLSLGLYGPVNRSPIADLGRFAGLFVAGGAIVFLLLVGASVGISHVGDVLRTASAQSGLVMAGVSNSVWSDDVGLSGRFDIVNGWGIPFLQVHGDWRGLLQTYGFALLLMLGIALLASTLRRCWPPAAGRRREFLWKFAGVTVGAYALHLFSLLRSDLSHLAGPSFLLPLFLLMLPMFAWSCLRPGLGRGVLLAVSLAIIGEALFAGRDAIADRIEGAGTVWRDSTAAFDLYRELREAGDNSPDPAARYTPIARYQAPLRNHPRYGELEELISLLHERLHGRSVELAFQRYDELVTDAELLYFFGGFRSVTGITSQKGSIWLKSDEDAWIDKVLNAKGACVFFDSKLLEGRMFEAWQRLAEDPAKVVAIPIVGRRPYGLLLCKT